MSSRRTLRSDALGGASTSCVVPLTVRTSRMPVQRTDAGPTPLSGGETNAREATERDEPDRGGRDPRERADHRIREIGPRHDPVRERGDERDVREAMESLPLPERERRAHPGGNEDD